MRRVAPWILAGALALVMVGRAAAAEVVPLGAGGYFVEPSGKAPFQTANVNGSPPTTYVVYNMTEAPRVVKFTEGTRVEAKTQGWAVATK